MLDRVVYRPGSGNMTFDLNGPDMVCGRPGSLHSSRWEYDRYGSTLTAARIEPDEVDVPLAVLNVGAYSDMKQVADRDLRDRVPGRIYVNGWYRRCYIVGDSPKRMAQDAMVTDLRFLMIDGHWLREITEEYGVADDGAYLDLPYDLSYDLGASVSPPISGSAFVETRVGFTIEGPANSPAITIAGNTYKVNADVPKGYLLRIDPLSYTVEMVAPDGVVSNLFDKAVRGGGVGSGSYIFQPLPPGTHSVVSDGGFAFTVTAYAERGEPEWA